MRIEILLGPAQVSCEVARTAAEQARGLQGRPELADGRGMLFPFPSVRAATFHAGTVNFPFDIVFVDGSGRIAKVVHAVEPGTRVQFSHTQCSAVVETRGGFCARAGVRIGQSYNPLRTIVEAADPLMDGYYSKEPVPGTELPTEDVNPSERFREHRLPDESFPEAMDQPNDMFREQYGYQPTDGLDGLVGPNVRMSSLVDNGQFVATIVEAFARANRAGQAVAWQPDPINVGKTESAVIGPSDIQRWLGYVDMEPGLRAAAMNDSTNSLQQIADGLVLAGAADLARVRGDHIALFRGRQAWIS